MSTLKPRAGKNQYIFYHEDGLVDIFVGIGIFFGGLFLLTEMVWMVAIFVPIFLPAFQAARMRLLKSRIGDQNIAFGKQTQHAKLVFSITLLLGLLLFAGFVVLFVLDLTSGFFYELFRQYILLVLGVIFAGVWLFVGMKLRIKRFYFYSLITLGAMSMVQVAILPFWLGLIMQGATVTTGGLLCLILFLYQHPDKSESDLV